MEINNNVPIWEKQNLTLKEAASYYNIGDKKLRELISDPSCDYVIYVGRKALIKRKKFNEYLDNLKYL